MDSILEAEVNALITTRILAYHQGLIDSGQIREFESSLPVFDCNQLAHKHIPNRLSEDPAPQPVAHSQLAECGSERE